MTPKYRTRPYKAFLTPALHRRFRTAAYLALFICYVISLLIGECSSCAQISSSSESATNCIPLGLCLFPIGRTGIRTLLLSLSSLMIFVLRVAQLHIDARNTKSPFDTFSRILLRFSAIQTLSCYLVSAWWFSEIYFWSASDGANLGWILEGKPWEKKRLNERPIYIRSILFLLALLQSIFHLYYDYDRVHLSKPVREVRTSQGSDVTTEKKFEINTNLRPHTIVSPWEQVKATAPLVLQRVALRSAAMAISGPFMYALFVRHRAWHLSLSLAQLLWDMPAAAAISYLPPSPIWLVLQSLYTQFLLLLLWESSNTLFSAFVAQEPLRKGQLLSDESRDPNGTLLNGLHSKREVPKAFALWELVYISHCSKRRRKLIFEDIDRMGGSAWEQVRSACLGLVLSISDRITQFQSPPDPSARQHHVNVETLPRLSAPLRQDPILNKPPPLISNRAKIESNFGAIAKSYGQQPSPFLSPRTKQIFNVTRNKLLTPKTEEQLLRITPANLRPSFDGYLLWILDSSFGWPFRQSFPRIVCSIIFKSPDSQFGQIIDAIDVLSALTVASLEEDRYGKVAKDVALLIQTYGATISAIEVFVASLPVHWTDTEFKSREVVEVDTVLVFLKSGLKEMLHGFSEYAKDLGISEQEIQLARKISGMQTEM